MNEWAEEHGWAGNVDQLNWGAEDGDMYPGYGDELGEYGSGHHEGYYGSYQREYQYPYADGDCEDEVLLLPPPPPPLHPFQRMHSCCLTASTCHNGS